MIHHTRPGDAVVHPSGWAALPGLGVEITRLPILDAVERLDDGTQLFARLTYEDALEVAERYGARLITQAAVEELGRVGLQLYPYLGTPKAETDILHSRRHDADVWRQLRERWWDGQQPVAGAGKHWIDGAPEGRSRLMGWDKDGPGPGKQLWQPPDVAHNRQHHDDGTTTMLERTLTRASNTSPSADSTPVTGVLPALGQRILRVVRPYFRGDDVLYVQRRVDVAVIDGIYGPQTEAAVRRYQVEHGLRADGVVGPQTWSSILASETAPPPSPLPTVVDHVTVPESTLVPLFISAHPDKYRVASRRPGDVIWIVLHSTQNDPRPGVARSVAAFFAAPPRTPDDVGSAHWIVGPEIRIQSVRTKDVAYGAGAANRAGEHVELTGYAEKTDWQGDGWPVIVRAAPLIVERARVHGLPLARLGAEDLIAGKRGLTTHASVSEACRLAESRQIKEPPWYDFSKQRWKRTTHRDPGLEHDQRWPWDDVLTLLRSIP